MLDTAKQLVSDNKFVKRMALVAATLGMGVVALHPQGQAFAAAIPHAATFVTGHIHDTGRHAPHILHIASATQSVLKDTVEQGHRIVHAAKTASHFGHPEQGLPHHEVVEKIAKHLPAVVHEYGQRAHKHVETLKTLHENLKRNPVEHSERMAKAVHAVSGFIQQHVHKTHTVLSWHQQLAEKLKDSSTYSLYQHVMSSALNDNMGKLDFKSPDGIKAVTDSLQRNLENGGALSANKAHKLVEAFTNSMQQKDANIFIKLANVCSSAARAIANRDITEMASR